MSVLNKLFISRIRCIMVLQHFHSCRYCSSFHFFTFIIIYFPFPTTILWLISIYGYVKFALNRRSFESRRSRKAFKYRINWLETNDFNRSVFIVAINSSSLPVKKQSIPGTKRPYSLIEYNIVRSVCTMVYLLARIGSKLRIAPSSLKVLSKSERKTIYESIFLRERIFSISSIQLLR